MTQPDYSAAIADGAEPSPIEQALGKLGIESPARLRELPRKRGRRTEHDDAVERHNGRLVDIVELLAEKLVAAEGKADARHQRYARALRTCEDRDAALNQVGRALSLLWQLGVMLRNCPGSPEIVSYPSPAPGDEGITDRQMTSYQFSLPCGVVVDYRPWVTGEQMQVTLKNGATEHYRVKDNGTLSDKERRALMGFLLEHGIKAEFPIKRPAGHTGSSVEARALAALLAYAAVGGRTRRTK